MSSEPSEIIFKSDQESIVSMDDVDVPYYKNVLSNVVDLIEVDDDVTPLFLHLTCSVHICNSVYRMPVKVLPTCLGLF